MPDLKTLTHDQFEACLKQPFQIELEEGGPLEVELIVAEPLGSFNPEVHQRQGFSLIFRGPETPFLPQGMVSMRHAAFGQLDIFLVPIGPDEHGMRYEAVFT